MSIVEVLVPQMGEGLQEVLVVELLKQPGDRVSRDEAIYSMETDKATLEVESPHDGLLVEWLASEGDTRSIGSPIARIDTDSPTEPLADAPSGKSPTDLRALGIPPRTRSYAKEKGVDDSDLAKIPPAGARLMPADIDAWLGEREKAEGKREEANANEFGASPLPTADAQRQTPTYTERALSARDRTQLHRLRRGASLVIPAVAKRQMDWGPVRAFSQSRKAAGQTPPPSAFNAFAFCVARAVAKHPKFRSTLLADDTVREFAHVNLGIAVAVPNGDLATAVVMGADTHAFSEFVRVSRERIDAARAGDDQADDSTQLLLTYMGPYEITDAIPVLIAPAVAVLFIGSPFDQSGNETVNLVLTFDHRLIHGVEAAEFLRTIVRTVGRVEQLAAGAIGDEP